MPPVSSLVFVVILAVWAVYLVQHWVRRRDHLATARSVDRFSEAMRVLERRRALPVPEVAPPPRSYAASPLRPARPARPEVVVKRAVPRPHGATAVAPSREQRRSHAAARLRAGGLLAGSLTMLVLVGLAITGVLPRWTALVGIGVCGVAFALVRWSVARERASWRQARGSGTARRPAVPSRSAAASRSGAAVRRPVAGHRTLADHRPVADPPRRTQDLQERSAHPRHTHDGHEFSAQSVAATLRTTPRRESGRVVTTDGAGPELYDIHAVEASLTDTASVADGPAPVAGGAEAHGPAVAEQPDAPVETSPPADGTWDPVPVPPPTYTLKAKAYRPMPGSSTMLPADGTEMALDEEFEDLPRIDRVG